VSSAEGPVCAICGFELWVVLGTLTVTSVGLYDDARFPGRLLLSLDSHYEHLEDVPEDLANWFISDIQAAARMLRKVTGAERVNVAILGNQEPHVHAHLVPRFPLQEPFPKSSPWQDPRPRRTLGEADRTRLVHDLTRALG
jgi:diadenosine tetraphosphate (Ap4A) HIT family hydrolase